MKKILTLLIGFLLILTGCSTATTVENQDPCISEDGTYEITYVADLGSITDKSFNQGTWEGIQEFCTANEDVDATYIETTDAAQYETNLQLASTQSEVVVASGFAFATPVYNVASNNLETSYVLVDAEPTDANGVTHKLENVASYYFSEQEAGYLVGYIAGSMTNTNHIGFIGGMPYPTVSRFAYGFVYGAQEANPEITIDVQYAMSFEDTQKGQTIANTMYSTGADIIFTAGGGVNTGVINEAIQRSQQGEDVWVIGVDRDMYEDGIYSAPDGSEESVVLTSAVKKVGSAAYTGLDGYFNGEFSGGEVTTLGYKEDGVGLPSENPNLDEVLIEEATKSLEQNSENIPSTLEECEKIITTATISGELQ